jgi:protein arginine kinase activator
MDKCPVTGKPCNNPKDVHVQHNLDGKLTTFDCCQGCNIFGSTDMSPFMAIPLPIVTSIIPTAFSLMQNLVKLKAMEQELVSMPHCEGCGASLREIKAIGRIGCAKCYEVFKDEIAFTLPQMQAGGRRHIGKRPKKAFAADLGFLKVELQKAIKEERYELAAQFRDQIKELEKALQSDHLKAPDQGIKEDTV